MKLDYRTFGERVLLARRRRGMTQPELARHVGRSASHISDIEHGTAKPSYAVIADICALLDIAEPDALTEEGGEL